ncbi:hypothetical protein UCDDS831_g08146 [Diplodia seriata]|uniref:Uncharacterized protein n=1 Tax=Diplodia seriata TaxID=420778 RepID=A0A0G2DWF5_9PEZI|nr:hypothetical protein UCDDS831_g08146 [Diplodia seriata]
MRAGYILPTFLTLSTAIYALPAPTTTADAALSASVAADIAAALKNADLVDATKVDAAVKLIIQAAAAADVKLAARDATIIAEPDTRLTDLKGVAVSSSKVGTEKVKAALGTKAQADNGILNLDKIASTAVLDSPKKRTTGALSKDEAKDLILQLAVELDVDVNVV